ncbi:MAG: hypothetical protein ACNA8P_02040 [Phycisphaerales bacterium]
MSETPTRSTAGQLLSIIASGWARLALTFVAGTIITLLMIREFGLIRFGMFVMIVQVTDLTVYTFLSALSRSMIREFSALRVRKDYERLVQVFSSGVVLSTGLFLLIASLGVPLQALGVRVLDFAPDLHTDLRNCILATALLSGLYIGITPWQALVISSGRIVHLNFFMLLNRMSDLVAILVVLKFGFAEGFIAFVWLRVCLRAIVLLSLSAFGRSVVKQARFSLRAVSRKTLRELTRTGGWAMSIPISQFSFYELDQLLLNLFAGPIYNSIYGISNQIRGYARLAGSSIILGTDAMASDLQERGRIESVRNVLDATIRFPLVITGCCAILLAVFAEPVITVWLGNAIAEGMPDNGMAPERLIGIVTTFAVLILIGTVIAEPHYTAASVLYGMGHLRRFSPIMLVSALAKPLIAAGLLAAGMPAITAILVTLAMQVLLYGIYFPWLIADVSKRTLREMWWTVYFYPLLSLAIFLGIALTVRLTVPIESLPVLAVVLAGVGCTYAPLGYFVALKPAERARLVGMVKSRLGRGRKVAQQPVPSQSIAPTEIDSSSNTPL